MHLLISTIWVREKMSLNIQWVNIKSTNKICWSYLQLILRNLLKKFKKEMLKINSHREVFGIFKINLKVLRKVLSIFIHALKIIKKSLLLSLNKSQMTCSSRSKKKRWSNICHIRPKVMTKKVASLKTSWGSERPRAKVKKLNDSSKVS